MSVSTVRERVQLFLTKHGRVELDEDGDFSVQFGSARAFVRVVDWGDGDTVISVWAIVVVGARPSPALNEYIAYKTDDYVFGHLSLLRRNDGTVNINLSHRILGNFLDEAELLHTVVGLAQTADELDDKLVAQFGGHTFHRA